MLAVALKVTASIQDNLNQLGGYKMDFNHNLLFTNINEILDRFNKNYKTLYDNDNNLNDKQRELWSLTIDQYDRLCRESDLFRLIRDEFNNKRGDIISSDREVIAYMCSLADVNLISLTELCDYVKSQPVKMVFVVKEVSPESSNFNK